MRTWLVALLGIGTVLVGGAGYFALTFETPQFGVIDRGDWQNVTDESITVNSTVWIDNPNVIGLPLGFVDASYVAKASNLTLAEGEIDGINIGRGNQTISFVTEVKQGNIPEWWVDHLKAGEQSSIAADVAVGLLVGSYETEVFRKEIDTNITGRIQENLGSLEGTYEGPGIERSSLGTNVTVRPEIEVRNFKASWGDISTEESQVLMDVTLYNPNSYAIPTPTFAGNADVNNITVANWTANPQNLTELPEDGMIPPRQEAEVRFEASLMNQNMDDWFETHVRRGEYTDGNIDADLIFEMEGKRFKLPAGGLKCEMNIQTAVLVDDEENNFENKGCEQELEEYADSLTSGSEQNPDNGSLDRHSGGENFTEDEIIDSGVLG